MVAAVSSGGVTIFLRVALQQAVAVAVAVVAMLTEVDI